MNQVVVGVVHDHLVAEAALAGASRQLNEDRVVVTVAHGTAWNTAWSAGGKWLQHRGCARVHRARVLLHLVHTRKSARAHRTREVARTVDVVVVAEVGDLLVAHQTLPLAWLQFDEHAVDHVRAGQAAACCKNQTRRQLHRTHTAPTPGTTRVIRRRDQFRRKDKRLYRERCHNHPATTMSDYSASTMIIEDIIVDYFGLTPFHLTGWRWGLKRALSVTTDPSIINMHVFFKKQSNKKASSSEIIYATF